MKRTKWIRYIFVLVAGSFFLGCGSEFQIANPTQSSKEAPPANPDPVDPEPTDPELVDLEPSEPDPINPEPTNPDPVNPEPTDPAKPYSSAPIYDGCDIPKLNGKLWYVDPINGSATGDGSATNPWRTLEEVFSNKLIETQQAAAFPYNGTGELVVKNAGAPIKAGDTLLLLSGHHGAILEHSYHNSEFIRIAAAEGHTPILNYLQLHGASKWIIDGLTFKGKANPMLGIRSHGWHGPSTNVIYLNNSLSTVEDISSWSATDWINKASVLGIAAAGECQSVFNNKVRNIGYGINITGERSIAQQNTIQNFSRDGMRTLASRQIIRWNTILDSYDVDDHHDDGIQSWTFGDPLVNQVLDGNMIINNTDPDRPLAGPLQGIGFFDGFFDDIVVQNNVVITDHWHGISLYGTRNATIINNTVVASNPDRRTWILINNHKDGRISDGIIRNNIATHITHSGTANVILDHNLIIPVGSAEHFLVFDWSNLNFDLRLKSSSSAINAGASNQAPLYDRDNILRDNSPDMGAYEFK